MWHEGSRAGSEERAASTCGRAESTNIRSASGDAELCAATGSDVFAATNRSDGRISARARNAVRLRSDAANGWSTGIRHSGRFCFATTIRADAICDAAHRGPAHHIDVLQKAA